ncbi:DUF3301 domain-containing protein [Psychrobium sp. 1_MG-2023]|uniref:DUF3301 domain-containing protein n=1 Tax=Psychrobium sp. 1_MG-2023 TaxID=3062624 RepID=UPI000C32CFC5|nr:DUF3301 domain-containing protein [Psychrobium sp. 1_MG-2023]MDP2560527.1 DUF3301 domain-containing protein [Psychrobium sp. 1_MG-2023]PKF57518.1 DUF3301 domain-containing protein [Alteromonadales bacterium alter-6D02]
MALLEILSLLVLITVVWLFWQTRVMAEIVKTAITDYCEQHNLQLLAVARLKLKPSRNSHGRFCWQAKYQFEFSSDGESYYIGYAVINGKQILNIETPAYRQG